MVHPVKTGRWWADAIPTWTLCTYCSLYGFIGIEYRYPKEGTHSLLQQACNPQAISLGIDCQSGVSQSFPIKPTKLVAFVASEGRSVRSNHNFVGDRNPRLHEFSVQLRAFDTARNGTGTGMGVLLALCSSILERSLKGGLIVVGALNLGGTIDPVHNPVSIAELAIEKNATTLLMPISARRQLFNLPDELAAKIDIQFYTEGRDALIKAILE